ncbi:MAG: glycoside hydrolase family 15 [Terracoccus sp.]
MGRRVGALLALTAVAAATAFVLPPRMAPPEALPGLVTTADWRAGPSVGGGHAGDALLLPVRDAAWLATGSVTGSRPSSAVVSRALLDLHALQQPDGAVLAGPSGIWAYVWPRDTAFAAAAYAVSGHPEDATRALVFLARVQLPDGGFEARYLPDGSGPPDDRQRQTDGAGWVLWALDRVRAATGEATVPVQLRGLRDRATDFILARTDDGTRLPDPSPDYWEVPERRLTLGTAAPLAAGLEAAARTYAAEGSSPRADRVGRAATAFRSLVLDRFGPAFERHGDTGGLDAGVAMLLPPFADGAGVPAAVRDAWRAYQEAARRPGGGLAPGADWKQDGVSWTPETALVAYTAAMDGDRRTARDRLDWVESRATAWGSLPEKVLPDGSPAGPAPLAWTAALVVLTEHALSVS